MFYFGAATSSHQVEGGNQNDWSEWEKETAGLLAKKANEMNTGMRWPHFILKNYPNPLQEENYVSGRASSHYARYKEDFKTAKLLGHNAHRLSLEWSRIEPQKGIFNSAAIAHYKDVIKSLRKNGLEPFVTIWHWPLPFWVRDQGGWTSSKTREDFVRFTKKVAEAFKDDVRFWITLNEPEIYATNGYLKGVWPPQKKNPFSYLASLHNLIKAHKLSFSALKKINAGFQIGIAKNNIYFEAYQNKPINLLLKKAADWWWNFYILDRIADSMDFIGLNYYFHNRINSGFNKNENKLVSDMGWELYPDGLYYVLTDLKKYGKPIYVTENGLADAEDKNREWFIGESLSAVRRAQKDGADVRGYFYWSLLDNFEWDKGFWPRFGLIAVNYKTMKRTVRKSALAYKKLIKQWTPKD